MKIVSAELHDRRWFVEAGGAARSAMHRESLVLALRDERGRIALGEAAPLPGMSIDTLDDARRDLQRLARELSTRSGELSELASPSARFAFETARFAFEAASSTRPIHELFEGHVTELPCAATVDTVDEARAAFANGYATLKVKVGPDMGPAHAIHRAVPNAKLRLDANRAWTLTEAVAHVREVAALPIECIEEPCANAYRAPWLVPLALDESLAAMSDDEIDAALRSPSLATLVLKPTLLGFVRCIVLAARARAAGKQIVVTHALEGPIGTAACAELALALGGTAAAGLAPHRALGRHVVPQLAGPRVVGIAGTGIPTSIPRD